MASTSAIAVSIGSRHSKLYSFSAKPNSISLSSKCHVITCTAALPEEKGPIGMLTVEKASQPGKAKIAKELKKKKMITGTRMNVDPYEILKYPLTTEHALKILEQDSTVVFIVDKRADKKMIRAAVEKMYSVKTKKINTLVRPQGDKKAFIMCEPEVAKKISIF